jgi:hypothetical protein
MEPSRRNQWQSAANGLSAKTGKITPKPLPWVATGCRGNAMVRVHPQEREESISSLRRKRDVLEPEGAQNLTPRLRQSCRTSTSYAALVVARPVQLQELPFELFEECRLQSLEVRRRQRDLLPDLELQD